MHRSEIRDEPTDVMYRRTPLPLCERFLWSGSCVSIRTDSSAILRAAEEAGFRPLGASKREADMQWEIVAEPQGSTNIGDWECKVTIDEHALYISMGPEQWFAFDLQTGDAAGFAVLSDPALSDDPNAVLYLLTLASNVRGCLQPDLESHRYD
jgi:hypothetical protein